ncbi:MAG: glutamate formimidoyltransferase [Gemmatimonadota bacterium]|nr:glutamate formimidoyltransferase [Gemmatimonadota bacterium]
MKLIECVPNFSEGRDVAVVNAIRDRIAAVPGVTVLHVTSDAWHNRSVITFVASVDVMPDAAIAAVRAARDHIDLTRHEGVHPRIGAADVVPFIPLEGASMEDCIAIAREVGRRVGEELGIPVYLYERAATRPSRRNLADVRRGGLESLSAAIGSDPEKAPDFGPSALHPTAGAVAIGARPFLVAFNAYIGPASNLAIARQIARAIRESGGGVPAIKALALEVDGQAQVSLNLVDLERTGLAAAYAAIDAEARARGAEITWSEIIGLIPERVASDVASRSLRLRDDIATHLLENRLAHAVISRGEQSLSEYISSVAGADAIPGGGSVSAVVAALASALVAMVASLTIGRERYSAVEPEMRQLQIRARLLAHDLHSLAARDAESYARVTDARRQPHDTPESSAQREIAIRKALLDAISVPLAVSRLAVNVVDLALGVARNGNSNAITDAGTAALVASAACASAGYNVRINARSLRDPSEAAASVREACELAATAATTAALVADLVEAAL